jgi:hypothetical protein
VQGQDFEFEKLLISEAPGLALHGLDFVVGAFQGPVRLRGEKN